MMSAGGLLCDRELAMHEFIVSCLMAIGCWIIATCYVNIALLILWSVRISKVLLENRQRRGFPMWLLGLLFFTGLAALGLAWNDVQRELSEPALSDAPLITSILLSISVACVYRLTVLISRKRLSEKLSVLECFLAVPQIVLALPPLIFRLNLI